jgi:hypothetical protein
MNLNQPFITFLKAENASVRLYNLLTSTPIKTDVPITLVEFMHCWPLARLKKEVFGFGPQAQKELHDIFKRIITNAPDGPLGSHGLLCVYTASLEIHTHEWHAVTKLTNGWRDRCVTCGAERTVPNLLPSAKSDDLTDCPGCKKHTFWRGFCPECHYHTPPERTCVHCGCTDSHACPGGCSWVVLHKHTPTGVCSNCAITPAGTIAVLRRQKTMVERRLHRMEKAAAAVRRGGRVINWAIRAAQVPAYGEWNLIQLHRAVKAYRES